MQEYIKKLLGSRTVTPIKSNDEMEGIIKIVKFLDKYFDIETHWIALYVQNNDVTYFDNFGLEHILKEIKKFIDNKSTKTNIFKIQAHDSIMCRYFCIGFIDFMIADFTNLFSPNNFKKMMI